MVVMQEDMLYFVVEGEVFKMDMKILVAFGRWLNGPNKHEAIENFLKILL